MCGKRFGRRIGLNGHLSRVHKHIEQIDGISPDVPEGEQFQFTTAADVHEARGDVGDGIGMNDKEEERDGGWEARRRAHKAFLAEVKRWR